MTDETSQSNPHTARQDAQTWERLYEVQVKENAKLQVIIETLARELSAKVEQHEIEIERLRLWLIDINGSGEVVEMRSMVKRALAGEDVIDGE